MTAAATPAFSRDTADDWSEGWSRTPHGLWTLDVPNGAKILLGWLHSHTDRFLAHVTVRQARRAVGSSSIGDWFDALEEAGYLTVARGDNGKPSRFTLKMAPWLDLIGNRNRTEIGSVTAPKSVHIEEQVLEDQSSSLRSEEELNEQVARTREDVVAREYWDWYVLENPGLKPTIAFLALRAVAKKLLASGHEPDVIVDAMKTARAWTAKALAAEIDRKRHEAEGRVATTGIPHAVVKACTLAEPFFRAHNVAPRDAMRRVARAMQAGQQLAVGETMLRLAVVCRDWTMAGTAIELDNEFFKRLIYCEGVPRSTEQPADYADAMERAYQNRRWQW